VATILRNFFKPKWQHQNPDIRLTAITQIDDEAILTCLIDTDTDSRVRVAALAKITNKGQLESLSQHKDSLIQKQATAQLLSLILQNKTTLEGITNKNDLLLIAAQADDETLRTEAINSIQDQQELMTLALNNPISRLRHAATAKIEGKQDLQTLLIAAKGKDKTQYRQIKARLDAIADIEKAATKRDALRITKLDTLESLSKASYAPGYQARLQLLWNDLAPLLEDANAEHITQASKAKDICQSLIDAHQAEEKAHIEKQQHQIKMSQEQDTTLESLTLSIEQIKTTELPDLSSLSGLIKTQTLRWEQATQAVNTGADAAYRFKRDIAILEALHSAMNAFNQEKEQLVNLSAQQDKLHNLPQLSQIITVINWPNDIQQPSELANALVAQETLKQLSLSKQGKTDDLGNSLKQQLATLEQSITDGRLKQSSQIMQQAQKTLKQLPGKAFVSQKNELQRLQHELNRLRDWQGFATEPKQIELCEKMEALLTTTLDAPELAKLVKDLQQEWKALNHSEKTLWDRFSAAADTAYEPCREYYAKQKEVRKFNLTQRIQICQQLEDFSNTNDWENADFKGLRVLLKQVREEWQKYSPVDRDAGKANEQAYYLVIDSLQNKLNEEYANNLALKKTLVEQATALIEEQDTQKAINDAKKLQNQWQAIGLTNHKEHQVLWQAFRTACDALFNQRDSQRKLQKEALEQTIQAAEHLVEEAEDLVKKAIQPQTASRIQAIRSAFNESDLPTSAQEKLLKRLNQVDHQLTESISAERIEAKKQAYRDLFILTNQCDEIEQDTSADATALTEAVNNLALSAKASLLKRLENLGSVKPTPNAQDEMKGLCIQAEILAEVDSPKEDQADRMLLQVARLQQGMGKVSLDKTEQAHKLLTQWCALSGVEADIKETFTTRLKLALSGILAL
jgi:hypothetical protein